MNDDPNKNNRRSHAQPPQCTEHGGQNVMHHAHTADANLSFDKYLSQSGVKYTHLGHFQANFFGNYKYDTTFYKYDTSYRYSYDNFAAESKRCGRDSIHHVPPHTKKNNPNGVVTMFAMSTFLCVY